MGCALDRFGGRGAWDRFGGRGAWDRFGVETVVTSVVDHKLHHLS